MIFVPDLIIYQNRKSFDFDFDYLPKSKLGSDSNYFEVETCLVSVCIPTHATDSRIESQQ